jgi:hypothetical protein
MLEVPLMKMTMMCVLLIMVSGKHSRRKVCGRMNVHWKGNRTHTRTHVQGSWVITYTYIHA